MVFVLKLRHHAPIAFGHVRHAEFFIFARLDGDGVVKAAPEAAITGLLFIGLRHFKMLERYDA